MSSCGWEERVALYAGGDLASADVERHLAECANCRSLLSGVRETMALAQAAHHEPIGEAHYSAVRARVLSEIEQGRARRWRFAWAYAMAAAAMVLAVAMWPRPELRLALSVPPAPAAPVVARVELPKARHTIETAVKTETVTMRIETDNPDVVIYWITESKGETK
jgi:hypothetical protein